MSNTQPPAQFDWATELSDAQGHVTMSAQEAKEIGARLRSMGAENETLTLYKSLADEYGLSIFKDLKDLGDAGSDMQLLRMGYAAARLEIESLKAQQPGTAYATLPNAPLSVFSKGPWVFKETGQDFSGAELDEAAFVAYREHASHGQAPAGAAPAAVAGPSDDLVTRESAMQPL